MTVGMNQLVSCSNDFSRFTRPKSSKMPYENRSLTPQQLEEAIAQRRAMGYPLHAPPHPVRDQGYYLISAANYEHMPIMSSPSRRTAFQKQLLIAFQEIQVDIVGWVILANHYHLLGGMQSLDYVSTVLKQLHGSTSFAWNKEDGLQGKRRVWYKFSDRMIQDDAHYFLALNYIHYNPVKHGYVADAHDWQWSSLSLYYEDHGREWLREKWTHYPPGSDFGKGWDDLD
jgi:putative transposase